MPALLGALTGDPEIEALLADDALLAAMLQFEAALAASEADVGMIREPAALAIANGIARYKPDWPDLFAGMARDGVVVPALVKQLRATVGEPFAIDVHRGATSQDVVDSALMMQLAKVIPILLDRLARLEDAFSGLREQYGTLPLMAHTRMQAAMTFTVADKLRSWSEPMLRHAHAIAASRPELFVLQLGGPVGDRESFDGRGDAIAAALASRLDLGIAPSWHATRDPIAMFGMRLAMMAGSLGKFGADIGLMAQTEVAAVTIAGGGTSSAMAHKSNPVDAEVLVALARHASGLAGTLGQAIVHEGERTGSAWTLEWLTLPQIVVAAGASLRIAQRLAAAITFRT